jgi:4'-phosphopantetheinyl transferase
MSEANGDVVVDEHLEQFRLADDDLHVWFESLEAGPQRIAELAPSLSSDELDRASRFRFARDRNRYLVGRGILRRLVADYTGESPAAIRFGYGEYGKPFLPDGEITFNVSHSDSRAVFAFCRGPEIGVDIEAFAPRPADRDVAERFFSPREVRTLLALPLEDRALAFLTCWTRKEAFIKAKGDGLSLSLQDFDVTFEPGVSPAILRTAWSRAEPASWHLQDLSAHCPGYVAALAVRARDITVTVRSESYPMG